MMNPTTGASPTSNPPNVNANRTTTPKTPSTQPTHDAQGNLLPAILCLHGGGSNATVFRFQARRLIANLSSQFRFVFAQAVIEGTPGTDMIPVFEDCAPFYHWISRKFVAGQTRVELAPEDEVDEIDQILLQTMRENGGIDSFVGVLGFSQGARLVGGLLLRQQVSAAAITAAGTQPNRDHDHRSVTRFKFGVAIGGPYPPISLVEDNISVEDYDLLKTIPIVVAWGNADASKAAIMRYANACDSEVSFQMEYEGGHHLPLKNDEARDLCDLIMAAWYAAGGMRKA